MDLFRKQASAAHIRVEAPDLVVDVAQLVESQLVKLTVAGSYPVIHPNQPIGRVVRQSIANRHYASASLVWASILVLHVVCCCKT